MTEYKSGVETPPVGGPDVIVCAGIDDAEGFYPHFVTAALVYDEDEIFLEYATDTSQTETENAVDHILGELEEAGETLREKTRPRTLNEEIMRYLEEMRSTAVPTLQQISAGTDPAEIQDIPENFKIYESTKKEMTRKPRTRQAELQDFQERLY